MKKYDSRNLKLAASALKILRARYLWENESPAMLFRRVAKCVASVEKKSHQKNYEEKFYSLMSELKFLPNTPTLMNAGRDNGQLSACFVLPIEDDLNSVFTTLKDAVFIHKTGGGTGFSFGNIRPKNDPIAGSGGGACGPIAIIKLFDQATEVIKQGGVRRGANMGILPINHPDVEEFIHSKRNGEIQNFNISIGVYDSFIRTMKEGGGWNLINPRTKKPIKKVNARKLWRQIAEAAWASGDPGVVFLDKINKTHPTPRLGKIESTNPCGEQPLLSYESCNLGSINILPYCTGKGINWNHLSQDIHLCVRFLDNVISANHYPIEAIKKVTYQTRKIGLGIMGWADTLIKLQIPYDSNEAIEFADSFMKRFNQIAINASEKLAKERGAFPEFKHSIYQKMRMPPRRNSTVTTIAPTGTISLIAGVSGGIEPVFALAHKRRALDNKVLEYVHPALAGQLSKLSRVDHDKIIESGSVHGIRAISAIQRKILKTAHEIRPYWHLKMQAVFQKHTENAVSKTINLPASACATDIKKIYELAFGFGCKGVTVFRDKSKGRQVLTAGLVKKL